MSEKHKSGVLARVSQNPGSFPFWENRNDMFAADALSSILENPWQG